MDSSEYKLLTFNHSEEEKKIINEFDKKVIRKALELLKFNRDKLLNDKDYSKLDIIERVTHVQTLEDYKEFCVNYPIVSKHIIAYGLFSQKAFSKYLEWKSKIRPSDEIRSKLVGNQREQEKYKNKYIYGMYIKYLFQEKGNHKNLDEVNKFYLDSVNSLNEEVDFFFDKYEEAKKEQDIKEKNNIDEKKKKIIDQLKYKLNT